MAIKILPFFLCYKLHTAWCSKDSVTNETLFHIILHLPLNRSIIKCKLQCIKRSVDWLKCRQGTMQDFPLQSGQTHLTNTFIHKWHTLFIYWPYSYRIIPFNVVTKMTSKSIFFNLHPLHWWKSSRQLQWDYQRSGFDVLLVW